MLCSGLLNPSRTKMLASLPSLRMIFCSAMPLPRASPSGLRWEVIRKRRPARMRSATSAAAKSGFVVVVGAWLILGHDLRENALDPARAHRRFGVSEIELRRIAEANAPAEQRADVALALLQLLDRRLRVVLAQAADEDARVLQVGTHFDVGDRRESEIGVFQIAAEHVDQRVADRRSDL